MFDPPDRDKAIEQYRARYEHSPYSPQLSYLYGLALVGRQTPEAIKLFDSALAKAPKFPWPHLSLVTIYASPNLLDKRQSAEHMKEFIDLCPAALEGYETLTRLDDKELIRQSAEKLRALLQTRTDPDALGAYSTLWSLEFKAHLPSEYDPLRKQVAEDLNRIRALNLREQRQWYQELEEGYKLVNDQEDSDKVKEERQRRFPQPWELAAMEKWRKDHSYPGVDDPADKKRAYYSDLLKQTEQWVKERPNTTYIWWDAWTPWNTSVTCQPPTWRRLLTRRSRWRRATPGSENWTPVIILTSLRSSPRRVCSRSEWWRWLIGGWHSWRSNPSVLPTTFTPQRKTPKRATSTALPSASRGWYSKPMGICD
jgi:hypothetical protein